MIEPAILSQENILIEKNTLEDNKLPTYYSLQKSITGFRKEIIESKIRWKIVKIVFRNYKNPFRAIRVLFYLDKRRRMVLGKSRLKKLAFSGDKYFWDMYTPGFPSASFNDFILAEANRIYPSGKNTNRFTNVIFAITKKCPLKCEHCFEWEALNQKEKLTLENLKEIISRFQRSGTSQIQLSGGEPLVRIKELSDIVSVASHKSEIWVLTSGFNLTAENAKKIKSAGLTGVVISLDHHDPVKHNAFRNFEKSYTWVEEAVKNSISENLLTALSICVTRDFITKENLLAYAERAKKLGVSFIQLLEPRAVGNYEGKNVELDKSHEKILEDFYFQLNYDKKYRHYPLVSYHGFHQRNIGCFSSGNRNLYVDTDGDIHACPFCRLKIGNALDENMETYFQHLSNSSCHKFSNATI